MNSRQLLNLAAAMVALRLKLTNARLFALWCE
jgi:hypothetical protein